MTRRAQDTGERNLAKNRLVRLGDPGKKNDVAKTCHEFHELNELRARAEITSHFAAGPRPAGEARATSYSRGGM